MEGKKGKSRKGNGMKIAANQRRGKYGSTASFKQKKRKDAHVLKSSHGKVKTVTDLENYRINNNKHD